MIYVMPGWRAPLVQRFQIRRVGFYEGLPTGFVEHGTQGLGEQCKAFAASQWLRAGKDRIGSTIGIGGRLTTPPLPHHLAYGSRTSAVRSG